MSEGAIKHCFQECGFKTTENNNVHFGIGKECETLFQQLSCCDHVNVEEFIDVEDNLVTFANEINNALVD